MSVGQESAVSPSEDSADQRSEKIRAHVRQVLQKLTARHAEGRRDDPSSTQATFDQSQGA